MKKVLSAALLNEVQVITENIIEVTEQTFLTLDKETLYNRPSENKWSVAECLEHLNYYSDNYHPEFRKAIQKMIQKREIAVPQFKSSYLGNFFANHLRLKDGHVNKAMNAPTKSNPIKTLVIRDNVVEEFLAYQRELLNFIKQSKNVNIGKVKLPTTLSKYIKIKLGDGLRVIVYHNERHVVQAIKVLGKKMEISKPQLT